MITADDFGAAIAVNEAVESAHLTGILTAASLMVSGDACADAVARAKAMPRLGIGLHIVLCDGKPVCPPEQLSWLVGADGQFHRNMVRTAFAIALFPTARRQMQAEVAAQFAAFAATGLSLDHVNAHKHFHLHPMILAAIVRTGAGYGMRALRMPYEAGTALPMRWWAKLLTRRLRQTGLTINDRVVGLKWTGAFDTQRMRAALSALQPGLTEIYTHPATSDDWLGCDRGYHYQTELISLTNYAVSSQLRSSGAVCGAYQQFTHSPKPAPQALPARATA